MAFGFKTLRRYVGNVLSPPEDRQPEHRSQERTDGGVSEDAATAQTAETVVEADDPETEAVFDRLEDDDPSPPEESATDETLEEFTHRLENLETKLDDNRTQLEAVDESQQRLADRMDDVDGTVRQLVGIYDQVTDDANPFTGEGEDANGFDVFGDSQEGAAVDGAETRDGRDEDPVREDSDPGETVSFDDLKDVFEEETEADEPVSETTTDEAESTPNTASTDDSMLRTLPNTYATDLVVFEWLTAMVQTAGPAAALRAIAYYTEIGWISDDVRAHLECVLSGPDLDVHVDPSSTPTELTAEDHADSYSYVMTLQQIQEMERDVRS